MSHAAALKAAGTSPAAVQRHYDLPSGFFGTWLGTDLMYSCALWAADEVVPVGDPTAALATAQERKVDHFAHALGVKGRRVLDVGCGWGALLDRFVNVGGAAGGVGLTLSPEQQLHAARRRVPNVDYRLESWVDHEPSAPYDAITCIEATEHLARDVLDPDAKVAVYRTFFDRLASWLVPGGSVGLQLICLDDVSHAGSRAGRGPLSELIRTQIFPESMSAALSELVLAWEPHFAVRQLDVCPEHYQRTFRAWNLALRRHRSHAEKLVDHETLRTFERYLAAGELLFRLREQTLYRVILTRRPEPKVWASPLAPSLLTQPSDPDSGASPSAVQAHYDLSNDFFARWLGPSMMYSSGMWAPGDDGSDLERALDRKIDYFLESLRMPPGARLLDIGCGWGGTLARALQVEAVAAGVGLTLSEAQAEYCERHDVPFREIRLEGWQDHQPEQPYDAIVSFGAFEHFARDGSTSVQRVQAYRRFFAACHAWLTPGGALGLETIAHEDAPDTAALKGRGPLGDLVLDLFPESLCPHLAEIVLGFEPWFRLEVLRSDAMDFARTFRHWTRRLRDAEQNAMALVGPTATRAFLRYFASSDIQFRTGVLTNYRFVLRTRPIPHIPESGRGDPPEGMDSMRITG